MRSKSGVSLYTPDGQANYHALWTRDLAYMLHGAGDLVPIDDQIACIEYLIAGAREDGWIPDRVEPDGRALYHAGFEAFPALANLDNGTYLMLAAREALRRLPPDRAKSLFAKWQPALDRGIWCMPIGEDGLMYNDTTPPHSPYGFTDCIAKTGQLCMESLILWEALNAVIECKALCGMDTAREEAARLNIEIALPPTFTDDRTGLLYSATGQCHQLDLWASAYALYLDFPLSDEGKDRISRYLIDNYGSVVEKGQLRHLPAGEFWEALFEPVPEGTYQNGAFWATPIEWLVAAIAQRDRSLAVIALKDLLSYFENRGIYECVNGDYVKLDTYVVTL